MTEEQQDAVVRVIKWIELQEDSLLERQAEAGAAIMLTKADVTSSIEDLRRLRDSLTDVF